MRGLEPLSGKLRHPLRGNLSQNFPLSRIRPPRGLSPPGRRWVSVYLFVHVSVCLCARILSVH